MHKLIAALVHAGDRDGAIGEAYRVFVPHTSTEFQCLEGLHCKDFDFFTILDPDVIEEQNVLLEQSMKKTKIKVRTIVDGVETFVEVPNNEDFNLRPDYRNYYRGNPLFSPPGSTEEKRVPGVILASDPDALHILGKLMASTDEPTSRLETLRKSLSRSNEELFAEETCADKYGYEEIPFIRDIKELTNVDFDARIFDHNSESIYTKHWLELVLASKVPMYSYDEPTNCPDKEVEVNYLPLWAVFADAHI